MSVRAFSLVELSIVLVILGLLVGGILSGRSLIEAAELRAVTEEMSEYQIAANTFINKYHGLPGDITNATKFWGDNASACADASTTDGSPGTCNGNGDGVLDEKSATSGDPNEGHLFWQHLALAGLIEGSYSGVSGPDNIVDDLPGENVPVSVFSNGCYHIDTDNNDHAGYFFHARLSKMMLELGVDTPNGDRDCDGALFTPQQVWNIDKKIDDGWPAKGKMIERFVLQCTDAADNFDLDAEYSVEKESVECSITLQHFPR